MGSHPCPTCGSTFDTKRGLGIHHSHVHDERLPNRECQNCGRDFYCDYEKKYCSEECRSESVSFEGAANPNYQAKKTETECVLCERKFDYYPSEKKGLYCPDCVENESWRTLPEIRGNKNPRWGGGKSEANCTVCGETATRYPSNITGAVTVCSDECRQTWLSEAFAGSGHPNWKGGTNEPYGKGWNRVRRQALERDGHQCVICSKSADDLGRNPRTSHRSGPGVHRIPGTDERGRTSP